jgi:hypothetical protein
MPPGFIELESTTALDQVDDQHDNGKHQEEMNESSQGVGADQSQQPEHEQNDKNSPQHIDIPFGLRFLIEIVPDHAAALI